MREEKRTEGRKGRDGGGKGKGDRGNGRDGTSYGMGRGGEGNEEGEGKGGEGLRTAPKLQFMAPPLVFMQTGTFAFFQVHLS